jgi:hypothetical protein
MHTAQIRSSQNLGIFIARPVTHLGSCVGNKKGGRVIDMKVRLDKELNVY